MGRALAATVIAVVMTLLVSSAVSAENRFGPYLSVEGMAGLDFGSAVGEGFIAHRPPEFPWGPAIPGTLGAFAGRIEAGYDFSGRTGNPFRAGLIVSGLVASYNHSGMSYGWVLGEPGAGGKPQFEIAICSDDPCAVAGYEASSTRTFWEVMPQFMASSSHGEKSLVWWGIQPFYGEASQNWFYRKGFGATPTTIRVDNSVNTRSYGALFSVQKETWFREDLKFFVSFGLGPYAAIGKSHTVGSFLGAVIDETRSMTGFRGQLGAGAEWMLRQGLSLGLVGRADFWSALPHVAGYGASWGGSPVCVRGPPLVCAPPMITGGVGIAAKPHLDVFVGLRLTYRPGN